MSFLSKVEPCTCGDVRETVIDFMTGYTTETTPTSATKIENFRDHLPEGSVVYITFLPGSDYRDTVTLAKRLRGEGMTPVPHFAARSIVSRAMLDDYLSAVAGEAGVDRVLCIAGAVKEPLGPYSDSMELLATGAFDKHGVKTIGVAGHPEGSPDFSDEAHLAAVKWKNDFAERTGANMHLVTQFLFEVGPVIAWDKHLNAAGNKLPIVIGVPGIASIKTLLNYAVACGVGNSINFIKRQASNVTKLLMPQAPDKLLIDLATYSANDPTSNVKGVHLYPLGGLKKTAEYARAVTGGMFTFNKTCDGFSVETA